MADSKNVTQAKPAVGGAISVADAGSTLPTDATTKLDSAFKNLGYLTTDGLTNGKSTNSSSVQAWGGDTVLNLTNSVEDTFKFVMMESLNLDVLKTIYGDDNVSGTLATGITVKSNSTPLEAKAYVIDMIMANRILKRIVIPNGSITNFDDVTYKSDDSVNYGVTVGATPDADGNSHYEYIVKSTTAPIEEEE